MEHLYVCHFSNGHIKVGRSIDPVSRIASHADRVACLGIELIEHRIFECVGYSAPAELALISRCAAGAIKRNKNEWFEGLDFEAVCSWAHASSISEFKGCYMTDSEIIDALGGTFKVAELCEVKPPSVSDWRTAGIPNARRMYLRAIRPDLSWPELVNTKTKQAV